MNSVITQNVAGASPLQIPQITPNPTAEFSATVSVAADQYTMLVTDTLTVSVDLEVSEGCQYPVYELTLRQLQGEVAILEYITPPTDTIGPGVSMPSIWTFRATQPGSATLEAILYGEYNCGGGWHWRYVSGQSESIHVMVQSHRIWIPTITKQ